jgi:hypothetical protein
VKLLYIFIFIGAALVSVHILLVFSHHMLPSQLLVPRTSVHIGASTVEVEIASTQAQFKKGLSGRGSLAAGHGMLFVFDKEGNWGMWMKGMQFPLDIIWANASGTIVTIEHSVSPDTYPTIFYPAQPTALYVLEVPAGFAAEQGVVEGMELLMN